MATVFDQLADAFTRRKQALAERERPASKLAGSDYFMPKSAKQDLANRLSVFEQGGTPELLKQAAQETYQNPAVNAAIGLTPVIGDLQSAYEAVKAAKEGQWAEAGLNALGVLPFVPALKTTWHGSPHGFTKFDLSKIGTGEGAQAYGHGAYLAEAPQVASQYKANRSYVGKALSGNPEAVEFNAQRIAQDAADIHGNDALSHLEGVLKANFNSKNKLQIAENQKVADAIELLKQGQVSGSGYLYKVDLPDEHIAKMLDWDKPLSEQAPEVLQALQTVDLTALNPRVRKLIEQNRADGQTIYKAFGGYENPAAASARLNELGIPGIQYLDQGSRGAGEGTRNYVVFDENIPTILERNGLSVF